MNIKKKMSNLKSGLSSRTAAISTAVTLAMLSDAAIAATTWTTAAKNVTEFGNSAVLAIVVLCAVGGAGAIGFAGKLLLKKSGERGEDVEWSKIGYATLAGAFLLSVSFVASTTIDTLGGNSASDIGKSIGTIK